MAARTSSHTTSSTADDAGWRRLNLVFMLNTSTRPLTTEEIVTDSDLGYGSDNLDSEMRKFRRDREALASCGIVIRNMQPEGSSETETGLWAIDRTSTFAATDELSLDELDLVIDALTKHLAIPQNPLSAPLASALKKAQIVRAVRTVLEITPPELAAQRGAHHKHLRCAWLHTRPHRGGGLAGVCDQTRP